MAKWKWEDLIDDVINSKQKEEKENVTTTTEQPTLNKNLQKNIYENKYSGEKVLVINTEMLKKYDYFQGMIVKDRAKNLRDKLLIPQNMFYIDRDEAENNPNYKQIIPYCVVSRGNGTFSYQRSKKGSENRLHDLWSIGIGGHVNPCDGLSNETILNACKREFEEEVKFSSLKNAGFVGLINDDSNLVNSVHLGVVYHVKLTEHSTIEIKDEALANGTFFETEVLKIEDKNWENWSLLVIKEYLRKI